MSNKVKVALSNWIEDGDRILDRRVVDAYDTEIVILRSADGLHYRVLRGFALGDGADVSVDVGDQPLENVLSYLLAHYKV